MEFDQEAIDRLSPEARVEVQEYYVLRDTKRRDYQGRERRGVVRWPKTQPWTVHAVSASMRSPWPASYLAKMTRPGSAGFTKA